MHLHLALLLSAGAGSVTASSLAGCDALTGIINVLQPSQATPYCSSFLQIPTATSTTTQTITTTSLSVVSTTTTLTASATSFTYLTQPTTTTQTVTAPATTVTHTPPTVYAVTGTCPNASGNDKRDEQQQPLQAPPCLSAYKTSALSTICSCLSIPTPVNLITSTSTSTVVSTSTSTLSKFVTLTTTSTVTDFTTVTQTTTVSSTVTSTLPAATSDVTFFSLQASGGGVNGQYVQLVYNGNGEYYSGFASGASSSAQFCIDMNGNLINEQQANSPLYANDLPNAQYYPVYFFTLSDIQNRGFETIKCSGANGVLGCINGEGDTNLYARYGVLYISSPGVASTYILSQVTLNIQPPYGG